jgi:acetolactate synthase I/II/III large subunit
MTIARQMAAVLTGLGIRRVYGLPGEDHMALLDAFVDAGLEYCTAYNESSAAIMAATDAQLTGRPGVVVLSLAPGVSNGVNGLLNTYLEEVPLILISGQHPAGQLPFVVRQGFDIDQLVTPFTKWRAKLTADMDIPSVLGRAVDEAMSGRQGPVYLEVPDAVATSESRATDADVERTVSQLRARWEGIGRGSPIAPDQSALDQLALRLGQAQRPALVIGGRHRRVTPETLAAFAEAFRVPVFSSSRQKGVIHSGSPFFAGTFLNGRLEKELLDDADLVLMIDPESFDFYNKAWCFSAPAIAITDAAFSEWGNPFDARMVIDPEWTLRALIERGGGASQWTAADVSGYRTKLRDTLLAGDPDEFSVARAVDAALDAWPRDGYITADAGFSKPLILMLSDLTEPDHFLASNALSTMGYSIPAAVAARRAGARPVLGFLGDGSLLMRATELMVSAGDGAPAVFVVMMDRALTQIEVKQERRKLASVGVSLPPVSCAKLAEALDIDGVDVESADELRAAVSKGLQGDRPLLIGVLVDPAPSRVLFDVLRG